MKDTQLTIIPGSIDDLQTEHASRGPSGADGWCGCALFPTMTVLYGDDESSEPAALGTAAHKLLEMCIKTKANASGYRGSILNESNQYPGGFVVDDDMIDAVQVAIDVVRHEYERMLAADPDTKLFTEGRVDPGVLFGRTDAWGTADITIINKYEVMVLDYKHGRGIFVPVEGKRQTILYTLGVFAELNEDDRLGLTYTHGVIQPRCPGVDGDVYRTEEIDVFAFAEWVAYFADRAAATDVENPVPNPGEDQCRWCDGKAHCQAGANFAVEQMFGETIFTAYVPPKVADQTLSELALREVNLLTPAQQVVVLDNADFITSFIKAVRNYVTRALKDGIATPTLTESYKLVAGLGNASWIEADEEVMLGKLKNMGFHKNDTVNEKIKSPTQIRKLAKHNEFTKRKVDNLEKLIERKERAPSLVRITDGRDAVPTKAEAIFGPAIPLTTNGDSNE